MHPLIEKFIAGQLPEPMALTLVGGGLPIPLMDLLQGLSHAVFQETPFAEKAKETLTGMPDSLLSNAIIGPVEPPDPLGLILMYRKDPSLLETALLHESLHSDWMERVIPFLPGTVLEIPLNNQVFWIERPIILDLIEQHPEAVYNIKRKIQEFRRDVLRQLSPEDAKERLEIIDDVEAGKLDKVWAELPIPAQTPDDEPESEIARAERLLNPIVDDEGQEISLSLTQRVMKLRTNQKIMLAQKGGKEERTLLIRESNRLIQVAVIRNGRVTEGEVGYIAQMRTVQEEVLRIISQNREWMKKYPIVRNLVQNPRTPIAISLNLLKRINEFDMKLMVKDRNVAELLNPSRSRNLRTVGCHLPFPTRVRLHKIRSTLMKPRFSRRPSKSAGRSPQGLRKTRPAPRMLDPCTLSIPNPPREIPPSRHSRTCLRARLRRPQPFRKS
jgi:hypothetical protein